MKKNKFPKRMTTPVSAGSMADIAFLLLIFFLVTTTIVQDKGLLVKLPIWTEDNIPVDINERNVLSILVNAENQILIEDKPSSISEIRDQMIQFITNPNQLSTYPSSPEKAIISISNHRDTDYKTYVAVYDQIKSAYQ